MGKTKTLSDLKTLETSPVEKCSTHKETMPAGYVSWHFEAERRVKAGQKQKQCPVCKLFFFKDEM
jgi:hypothetical protein